VVVESSSSALVALPVGERAYRAIKQRLFAGPRPGQRLDIVQLADLAHVSTTPVREALHRLAAERLVDNRAGEGFFVPRPSVGDLKRLYRWHGRLAAEATRGAAPGGPADLDLPYPELAAGLFAAIAGQAGDGELRHALANADERLRAFRRAEPAAAPEVEPWLRAAARAWAEGDTPLVRRDIARAARRLAAAAADILDRAAAPAQADIRDIER
jgi:hypothetical protein